MIATSTPNLTPQCLMASIFFVQTALRLLVSSWSFFGELPSYYTHIWKLTSSIHILVCSFYNLLNDDGMFIFHPYLGFLYPPRSRYSFECWKSGRFQKELFFNGIWWTRMVTLGATLFNWRWWDCLPDVSFNALSTNLHERCSKLSASLVHHHLSQLKHWRSGILRDVKDYLGCCSWPFVVIIVGGEPEILQQLLRFTHCCNLAIGIGWAERCLIG